MGVLSKQGDSAKCSVEDKNCEGMVQSEGKDYSVNLGEHGNIHCVGLGLCGGTMGTMSDSMGCS